MKFTVRQHRQLAKLCATDEGVFWNFYGFVLPTDTPDNRAKLAKLQPNPSVLCGDTFAYACADEEAIPPEDVQ